MISRPSPARRQIVGIVGLACSTTVLAGCGAGVAKANTQTQKTTVTLWESHSSGGPAGATIATLVKKFNHTHPNIVIDLTVTKATHKALGALAAGDAPTIAWISHYDGNFLSAHALVSWNPYMHSAKGMSAAEAQSIYPVVLHNGQVGSQHYRVEADSKVSQLTYNKALFAKAGITSPPATWAALAADVATIKQKLPGVIPLAWKDSSAHILPPFLSNGGHIYKPGSNQKQADFLSPAASATFTYFRRLYQAHEMILAHGSTIREDFGANKLAIADGTSAGYQKILQVANGRFPVGVFAYPSGSTGHTANLVQGLGFVLMKGRTQAEYQAASVFLSWWFSTPIQAYWGQHSGYPPETTTGYQSIPASYRASHRGLAVATHILQSPYTISRPVPDSYKEVQAALDTAFYNAVTGTDTVSHALQTLEHQANGYLNGQSAL